MQKLHLCRLIPSLLFLLVSTTAAWAQNNPGDAIAQLLQKEYKPDEPLISLDVIKESSYQDGKGTQVGIVEFVENEAYVIHADTPGKAYRAQKSRPVSLDDTLVCEEGSRLVVLLKDQSQLSVAPYTKIALSKVVYDPDTGSRDTLIKMGVGAARYVVTKTISTSEQNFQIETPLATIGIRGSDFAVALVPENEVHGTQKSVLERLIGPRQAFAAAPRATLVTTGPNTTLSITGLTGPPVVLSSFQVSVAMGGRPPSQPLGVSPSLVPGLLNRVGPSISVMGMPAVFE